jgi:S-adenosylmethionine decarboxylase
MIKVTYENFTQVEKDYKETKAWGMLTSIDVIMCNPVRVRSKKYVKSYIDQLCDLLKVKKYGESLIVNFGSGSVEGLSFTQPIETSLVSGHFRNENDKAYIDIFSCKIYDPFEAVKFTVGFFDGQDVEIHILLRK